MALSWSFSADKCFRRCQRQYYFREIAACHNAKDPRRREAFVLKQLKTVELWRGSLVHQGIERFVVPRLEAREPIQWDQVILATKAMMSAQLQFSAEQRYRGNGISKSKYPNEYCALLRNEYGQTLPEEELAGVVETIEPAFRNLESMSDLLRYISGRSRYWAELPVRVEYDGAAIDVRLDLLFFRAYGKPTIIDWKVYESTGGTDTHLQTALYGWTLCRNTKWSVQNPGDVELIEVRLLDPQVIRHCCTDELFQKLEDRIYRSLDGSFSSQELTEYEIKMDYRLVDVDGSFGLDQGDNDLAEKNLNTLARQVAFQEKAPVALIRRGATALLALPGHLKLSKLEYALVPDVVTLKPRRETHELNFDRLADEAMVVALPFLRFHLSTPLMRDDSIWSAGPSTYFSKRPINYKDDHRDIDVYGGFGFHLFPLGSKLYLILRLTCRYAENCWLIEGRDESTIRSLKMRHLLYHFGNRRFPVQLLDLLLIAAQLMQWCALQGPDFTAFFENWFIAL